MRRPRDFGRPKHHDKAGHDDIVGGIGVRYLGSETSNHTVKDDQQSRTGDDEGSSANKISQEDGHQSSDSSDKLDDGRVGEALGPQSDGNEEGRTITTAT